MFYSRWTSFVCLLICMALLIFAAYLQISLGLMPCPLCVIQRLIIAFLGLVFLVGSLYTPSEASTQRMHSGFIIASSLIGVLVAGRHAWLTMQPPGTAPTCSPTIAYMLQNLPMTQTLKLMLSGSGECSKDVWQLFGLNIPQWTLLFFIAFFIFGVVRYRLARGRKGSA